MKKCVMEKLVNLGEEKAGKSVMYGQKALDWRFLCELNESFLILFVVKPYSSIGLDYADPKKKNNFVGKILLVATLTALCVVMLKQSPTFNAPSPVKPLSFI